MGGTQVESGLGKPVADQTNGVTQADRVAVVVVVRLIWIIIRFKIYYFFVANCDSDNFIQPISPPSMLNLLHTYKT